MVLTSKARQLLPLGARRPVNALADVSVGLLHPSGNRLRGRLELTRQLLGRASGSHQIDHLSPELRRISGSIAAHHTPQQSTSRVSTKPGQLQTAFSVLWTCLGKVESSSEGKRSISWASRSDGSGRNLRPKPFGWLR